MKSLKNRLPSSHPRLFLPIRAYVVLFLLGLFLVSFAGTSIAVAAKKHATSEQLMEKSPLKQALLKAKGKKKDSKKLAKLKNRKSKVARLNSKKKGSQAKVAAAVPALSKSAPKRPVKNPASHFETKTEWLYDSTAATDKDCGQALVQAQADLKSLYEEQCSSLKESRGCIGCTAIEFGRTTKDTTSDSQCEVRLSAQWQAEDCISVD